MAMFTWKRLRSSRPDIDEHVYVIVICAVRVITRHGVIELHHVKGHARNFLIQENNSSVVSQPRDLRPTAGARGCSQHMPVVLLGRQTVSEKHTKLSQRASRSGQHWQLDQYGAAWT